MCNKECFDCLDYNLNEEKCNRKKKAYIIRRRSDDNYLFDMKYKPAWFIWSPEQYKILSKEEKEFFLCYHNPNQYLIYKIEVTNDKI